MFENMSESFADFRSRDTNLQKSQKYGKRTKLEEVWASLRAGNGVPVVDAHPNGPVVMCIVLGARGHLQDVVVAVDEAVTQVTVTVLTTGQTCAVLRAVAMDYTVHIIIIIFYYFFSHNQCSRNNFSWKLKAKLIKALRSWRARPTHHVNITIGNIFYNS